MFMILIDTNIYLEFYESPAARKLVPSLLEIKDHVLVTSTIVDEVRRNQLSICCSALVSQYDKLSLPNVSVSDQLLGAAPNELTDLRRDISDVKTRLTEIRTKIDSLIASTLSQVQQCSDPVSLALEPLFQSAVPPTDAERAQARQRKEVGNPPGKRDDPLGDQITWEQFLSRAKNADALWIVTKDGDYCTRQSDQLLINPVLSRDLDAHGYKGPAIRCFYSLADALSDLKQSGHQISVLPTTDILSEIKKEEGRLPNNTRFLWDTNVLAGLRDHFHCPMCGTTFAAGELFIEQTESGLAQRCRCGHCGAVWTL